MTASPYIGLDRRAFWRTGVSERASLDPGDLYKPRFPIERSMRIATAGSCFAQHVGRALIGAGFDVVDAEELPGAVDDAVARRFGFRMFSARYGNIYTARQLAQLMAEAYGEISPAFPVWRKGSRFFDSQRPAVEPDGLETEADVLRHREVHLAAVRRAWEQADLGVFTFGLTEAWIHRESGTIYPTAPGTIAGDFDPDVFAFKNYDAFEVLADFEAFRSRMKALNPNMRFLVTVSPVPLTATASGDHVEVATCYSKSTLRAVCGMLLQRHGDVDYFPSYELITSQSAQGAYYEPNQRNVTSQGVAAAMRLFLSAHGAEATGSDAKLARGHEKGGDANQSRQSQLQDDDAVCEEVLLESFAR